MSYTMPMLPRPASAAARDQYPPEPTVVISALLYISLFKGDRYIEA